jgi:hypothetical protein
MTYFPFPNIAQGRPGSGEVGETVFSVPETSLPFWTERFAALGVDGLKSDKVSARSVSISQVRIAMGSRWSRPRKTCACHGPAAASARITRSAVSTPPRSDSVTNAPPPNCSNSWATRRSMRQTASNASPSRAGTERISWTSRPRRTSPALGKEQARSTTRRVGATRYARHHKRMRWVTFSDAKARQWRWNGTTAGTNCDQANWPHSLVFSALAGQARPRRPNFDLAGTPESSTFFAFRPSNRPQPRSGRHAKAVPANPGRAPPSNA